LVIKALLL